MSNNYHRNYVPRQTTFPNVQEWFKVSTPNVQGNPNVANKAGGPIVTQPIPTPQKTANSK